MKDKSIIRKNDTLKHSNGFETFFNISITRILQILSVDPDGLRNLVDQKIPFDLILISSEGPKEITNFKTSRSSNSYRSLLQIIFCILCDIKNFYEIVKASFGNKKIVISSKRWVKDKKDYEKELMNIFKDDFSKNTNFVYIKNKKIKSSNIYSLKIRKKINLLLLNKFDKYSERYKNRIQKINNLKIAHLSNLNHLKNIHTLLKKNAEVNLIKSKSNDLMVFIIIFIYKLLNFFLLKFLKNNQIYIVNTCLWTIGNILFEDIILNRKTYIIGCQHGGGYGESKSCIHDYEIFCPSFKDFIGFRLFAKNINPSIILNLKKSNRKGSVSYICSHHTRIDKKIIYNKECFSLIKFLSKKYSCSVRVHPKEDLKYIFNLLINHEINLKKETKIDVFQPENKFEGISDEVKICIFDYPHTTLFWEAKSKNLITILIYDLKNLDSISKSFLKLFDFIISPEDLNWETKILRFLDNQNFLKS